MSLVQELIDAIIDDSQKLSTVLRRARVLAYRLGDEAFAEWTEMELDGYGHVPNADSLPDYRKSSAINRGNFVGGFGAKATNIEIPLSALPEAVRDRVKEVALPDSVAAIEQFVDEGGRIPWSGDMIAISQGSVSPHMTMFAAWTMVPSSFAAGIISAVRNRLLTFALELQKRYPEATASDEGISEIPQDEVRALVVNKIYGGQNVIASGSGFTQVAPQVNFKDDLNGLLEYVRDKGVPLKDAEELQEALIADKQEGSGGLGKRTRHWLGNFTASTASAGTMKALEHWTEIAAAIQSFFG